MSIFLQNLDIHESWKEFFEKSEVVEELKKIEENIGTDFTPKPEFVLRFATLDLLKMVVVLLGKDPYPQRQKDSEELVATGRAFEVAGVSSWFDKGVNSSLKNVVKNIHKVHFNKKFGASIKEVREDIENGTFPIPSPDKAFRYWEDKGVLFLNTAFTCKIGGIKEAGSHLSLWKPFFMMLLQYISEKNSSIRYFLWGDARKYGKKLEKLGVSEQFLYLSKHPCTNGDNGGYKNNSCFLNFPGFYETKDIINWTYSNTTK